jgi:hypothetical protein
MRKGLLTLMGLGGLLQVTLIQAAFAAPIAPRQIPIAAHDDSSPEQVYY